MLDSVQWIHWGILPYGVHRETQRSRNKFNFSGFRGGLRKALYPPCKKGVKVQFLWYFALQVTFQRTAAVAPPIKTVRRAQLINFIAQKKRFASLSCSAWPRKMPSHSHQEQHGHDSYKT